MNPRLNPLIAPSRVVPAAEASHEGADAETATHPADEDGETAMEEARAVPAPLQSQPTVERWSHLEQSLVRMRVKTRAQCR